jgi:hypothetical protein
MATTVTRAERLDRCIAALGPEMAQTLKEGWGTRGAPYTILELPSGRRRVTIWDYFSGDMWVGAGATLDEALTALEAKVLPAPPPDPAAPGGA